MSDRRRSRPVSARLEPGRPLRFFAGTSRTALQSAHPARPISRRWRAAPQDRSQPDRRLPQSFPHLWPGQSEGLAATNLSPADWHIYSIGAFTDKHISYQIVILTGTPANGGQGESYGIQTVQAAARVINREINF
jgi:hypothetical protein